MDHHSNTLFTDERGRKPPNHEPEYTNTDPDITHCTKFPPVDKFNLNKMDATVLLSMLVYSCLSFLVVSRFCQIPDFYANLPAFYVEFSC